MNDSYFNIYNILMLVGAIQGIIFSLIVSFSKKYRTQSLLFLAALILCFALNNLQYFVLDVHFVTPKQFYGIIYFPFATLSMVFFFLYVKLFLFPQSKISNTDRLLFLPFIIFFIFTFYYKITLASGLLTEQVALFFNRLVFIHEGFALLFSIFLIVLIFRQISKFEKENKDFSQTRLNWLKYTATLSFALCLLYGFCIYMEVSGRSNTRDFYYILWICQSFVIYWLGHMGIYKYGLQEEQKEIRKLTDTSKISVTLSSENEYISAFEKFIVEEKNYLNNELTLDFVAENLGLSKSYLSRMINAELHTSYTDYINVLRVEQAKLTIQNPESEKYTLIAIGFEAGFNSKSAFNSAFKKFTGITPSEFKKRQKLNNKKP